MLTFLIVSSVVKLRCDVMVLKNDIAYVVSMSIALIVLVTITSVLFLRLWVAPPTIV